MFLNKVELDQIISQLNEINTKESRTYIKQMERLHLSIINLTEDKNYMNDNKRQLNMINNNKELDMLNKSINKINTKITNQNDKLLKQIIEANDYISSYNKKMEWCKLDPTDITPDVVNEILQLNGFDIINDATHITYLRVEDEKVILSRIELVQNIHGDYALTRPIKYVTKDIPRNLLGKLSNHFGYDDTPFVKENLIKMDLSQTIIN